LSWLDVTKAFGAIPPPALEADIERSWSGEDFLLSVLDIYTGVTSSVSMTGGLTNDIPVRSGIKQGCPLSGLIFIMAIDPAIALLQGESVNHRVLSFADDLCLIANSLGELQASIDEAHSGLDMLVSGLMRPSARRCTCLVDGRWMSGTRSSCCKVPPFVRLLRAKRPPSLASRLV